mmetsp:Transcript_36974/g.83256  ORF Transcript_36974/g.83256 Transcript_36974/m.83256 type:complete len:927 (-) Transcript_36974:106-2886(-)
MAAESDEVDVAAPKPSVDDGAGTKPKRKKKKKNRNSSTSLGVSEHSQSDAEGGTTTKKKKKKKKPSSGNLSSSEPKLTFKVGSDGNATEVSSQPSTPTPAERRRQSLSRMHSIGDLNGGVSSDVEDSTVPIKPRRKDDKRDGMFDARRMTSFSKSTLDREEGKSSIAAAIRSPSPPPVRKRGGSPLPQSGFGNFGGGGDDADDSSSDGGGGVNDALARAMGKFNNTSDLKDSFKQLAKRESNPDLTGPTTSSAGAAKPALKPSKYGSGNAPGNGGAKRASFQLPDDNLSVDDSDASPPPRPSRLPSNRRRSFDSGNTNGANLDRRQSFLQLYDSGVANNGGENSSFRPQAMQVGPRRRPTVGSDGSGGLRGSFTGLNSGSNRPGIQRRNSMNSARKDSFKRTSFANDGADGPDDGNQRNNSVASRAFSSVSLKKREATARRIAMSVENQTYVPPKSRTSSIFSAMTHAMAGRLTDLTLWTYDASAFKVIAFFLVTYIVNISIWALVLDSIDLATGHYCIHENPEKVKNLRTRYEYVFELSWATFTTVGYGTISPQGDETGCYAVRFACAMVAFIGVLYAATTAAILYSKLMRLLAKAQVTFSSTLCVQYGKGNEGSTVRFGQLNFRASVAPAHLAKLSADDLLDDDLSEDGGQGGTDDGFPVIEFRMINDRANNEGSEIWDAQIRGIVQLRKEPKTDGKCPKDKATGGESTLDLEKKVYYPISLSPDTHPHFSRIWYARHTLNAESPLLKREVRDDIVANGGKWDKDYNCWEEVRRCLSEFITLRITLSGTSAVSATDVYGEHVYEFDDVCVGWRFANMVYEKKSPLRNWWGKAKKEKVDDEEDPDDGDRDSRTKIDAALLHDIVPQPGGDYEPMDETSTAQTRRKNFALRVMTFGAYNPEGNGGSMETDPSFPTDEDMSSSYSDG